MRTAILTNVYVCTYKSEIRHGVSIGGYTNLRKSNLNVQTDYSELDLQTYGQTVNEIIKLRSNTLPDISEGDYLYMTKPTVQRTFTIGGVAYDDYGQGEYQVESIRPAFVGVKTIRNPTLIEARKTTGGENDGS
ncbi:hypothetical protein [Caproiciproducens galactitolivorans]|uniref:Uncharacterized protein n=1 Tax=Caproiciproducens galactitolivorans TaxID=642589 RepID=A0ABT4BWE8_9FIRM|nr:hypothetical protein [Caproiciproducens galactitolivorans]MCY1715221.1 hypothetical protein [Caproiciproducens galactitolivorans]